MTAHDGNVRRQERIQGWLGEVPIHGTVPRQEWERLDQAKTPSPASHHSLELIPREDEGIKELFSDRFPNTALLCR